jgi:hypothetical protein
MIIDTVEISNLGLWENLFLKFDKKFSVQGVQTRLKRNDRFEISDRVVN